MIYNMFNKMQHVWLSAYAKTTAISKAVCSSLGPYVVYLKNTITPLATATFTVSLHIVKLTIFRFTTGNAFKYAFMSFKDLKVLQGITALYYGFITPFRVYYLDINYIFPFLIYTCTSHAFIFLIYTNIYGEAMWPHLFPNLQNTDLGWAQFALGELASVLSHTSSLVFGLGLWILLNIVQLIHRNFRRV